MPDQLPKAVVQERYERLVAVLEEISWAENKRQVGRALEVLVADGEGRKDGATDRMSGRAPDNRLVHFAVPAGADAPRPGDIVDGRGHLRRAAPPGGRRGVRRRPPDPRGRRLGGPPGRTPGRCRRRRLRRPGPARDADPR